MAKAQAQMRAGVKRSQKPETLGHIVSATGSPILAYKKLANTTSLAFFSQSVDG